MSEVDNPVDSLTHRQKIEVLENGLYGLPQVTCPVRHFFAPGTFAREITIPAGTVLVGAIHKMDNIVVLSKGKLRLSTESGHVEITAPHTLVCKAGAKNAAVALEDAVWTNFFPNPTNEHDIDVLVETFTESKASELLGGSTNKQLAANKAAEQIKE